MNKRAHCSNTNDVQLKRIKCEIDSPNKFKLKFETDRMKQKLNEFKKKINYWLRLKSVKINSIALWIQQIEKIKDSGYSGKGKGATISICTTILGCGLAPFSAGGSTIVGGLITASAAGGFVGSGISSWSNFKEENTLKNIFVKIHALLDQHCIETNDLMSCIKELFKDTDEYMKLLKRLIIISDSDLEFDKSDFMKMVKKLLQNYFGPDDGEDLFTFFERLNDIFKVLSPILTQLIPNLNTTFVYQFLIRGSEATATSMGIFNMSKRFNILSTAGSLISLFASVNEIKNATKRKVEIEQKLSDIYAINEKLKEQHSQIQEFANEIENLLMDVQIDS